MLATVLHAPGDVRFEDVAEPKIEKPTDAIIKLVRDLRLRVRPLALPRRCSRSTARCTWATNTAAWWSRSAAT